MIINDAGTYTLKYTATDSCGKTTEVERELVVAEPTRTLFGIRSTSASSSACVRTDDSALFADPIPQHSDGNGGWVDGSSPFDNYMPWSGIEIVEDADAGTLVKIPKFWYKWTRNGDEMQLQISNEERDGFKVSPAHDSRSSSDRVKDYIYVGRYHSADDFTSKTGVAPKTGEKLSHFRTGISNLHGDVWLWDFSTYWTIAMLYLVEFADWDSQKMIGGGCSESGSKENNGMTDGMTYHTGTTNTQVAADAYGHIQYRHIEDLWANVKDWVDGCGFSNDNTTEFYVGTQPSAYSDFPPIYGSHIGTRATSGMYATEFIEPPSQLPFALYPSSCVQDINDSRTHDTALYSSTGILVDVGGNYSKNQNGGMFSFGTEATTTYRAYVGGRLMKLPSA